MTTTPLFIPTSAGETFGSVLRTREAGRFEFRESLYAAGAHLPPHFHSQPYFSFVVDGDIRERSGAGESRYRTGSVHFHPAGDPHEGRVGEREARCFSIIVSDEIWRGRALRRPAWPDAEGRARAHALARRCHHSIAATDASADLVLEGLALELVTTVLRVEVRGERRTPRWLLDVRDVLHARFLDRVRLAELSAVAGVHEVHVVRAFRRHFGTTPGTYVRGLRIDHARRALIESDEPLVEIALAAGFSSQAHFTREFHRLAGETPAAYRRARRR